MDLHPGNLRPTSPTRPPTSDREPPKPPLGLGMWQKLHDLFGGDEIAYALDSNEDLKPLQNMEQQQPKMRNASRRPVGIGLPRQTTFKRQNSERRDRLCPAEKHPAEKRATSMAPGMQHNALKPRSLSSPAPLHNPRTSASAIGNVAAAGSSNMPINELPHVNGDDILPPSDYGDDTGSLRPLRPASVTSSNESYERQRDALDERAQLNAELDSRWILNLSMHFRDKSDREKFFVTYAEHPNKWRRVTVSVDYRNAEPGSLERDLKELTFQRDKSLQIYEAIRESLLEIQFYDTVTNLKLETSDGRLHVHVTEDVNEIIPYPPRNSLSHILEHGSHIPMECRESDLAFEAHLSGFVYKVKYKGRTLIKKEIPGPDTVDEFLYEVNALHALADSKHVIHLEGVVFDDTYTTVKGLLISYAEKGAVVDLLYDLKGEIPWERRQRWARHAVAGLSDVHEEGYVQGDFTLSNIVVDARDNARIIDINRRGCPVGWEPPELAQKIASNQRISMYIGQKSDLYQLGMSLWALAMDDDEPERHDPPLNTQVFPDDIPSWYVEMVQICLSPQPRDRLSAKDLLAMFPNDSNEPSYKLVNGKSFARLRTEKQYIDPETAVERDDLERFGQDRVLPMDTTMYSPQSSRDDYTFTYPRSSNDDRDYHGSFSEFERPRGRRRSSGHGAEHQNGYEDDQLEPLDDETPPLIGRIPTPVGYEHQSTGDDDMSYFDGRWNSEASASEYGERRRGRSPGDRTASAHAAPTRISFAGSRNDAGASHSRSQLSEPTPRGSALHLANQPDLPPHDVHSGSPVDDDLAWLGAHPNVDSPRDLVSTNQPPTNEHGVIDFDPPRLRFVDSGFNEPGMFGMTADEADEDCEGDPDNDMEQNLAEARRNRDTVQKGLSLSVHNEIESPQDPKPSVSGSEAGDKVVAGAVKSESEVTSPEDPHMLVNQIANPDEPPLLNGDDDEARHSGVEVTKNAPP